MQATDPLDPLSAILQRARTTLDTLAVGGSTSNQSFATKAELETLSRDVAKLAEHLASLERRISALERNA